MKKIICLMLLAALFVAGCGSGQRATTATGAQGTSTLSVTIANLAFSPATLTAKPGTKVTWTNNDSVIHTVTSDTGVFNSGNIAPGSTFSYTFNSAGSYAYHCTIHPNMKGTILVQ